MTSGRIAINPDEVMAWSGKLKSLARDIETASQAARQLGGLQLPPEAEPIASAVLSDTRILQGGSETFEVVSTAARAMALGAEKADAGDGGDNDALVEISGKVLEGTKVILGGLAANLIAGSKGEVALRLVDMLIGTTAAATGSPVLDLIDKIADWREPIKDGLEEEKDGTALAKLKAILKSAANDELDTDLKGLLGDTEDSGALVSTLSSWISKYSGVGDPDLAIPALNDAFTSAAETAGKFLTPLGALASGLSLFEGGEGMLHHVTVENTLETISGGAGAVTAGAAASLAADWWVPGPDVGSFLVTTGAGAVSLVTGAASTLIGLFSSSPPPPPLTMAQRLQQAYANDPAPPWEQLNDTSIGPIDPGAGEPSFGSVG